MTMPRRSVRWLSALLLAVGCGMASPRATNAQTDRVDATGQRVRIATFNIEDLRLTDLRRADHPRLDAIVRTIIELDADAVLINEIEHDGTDRATELLARRVADAGGPEYTWFTAPSNTGQPSGLDLNNDGQAVTAFPEPPMADAAGAVPRQTAEGRAYGNDTWGFGTFPGQYAMALLVREPLEIQRDNARTFRLLPWSAMPDAARPIDPETGEPWHPDTVWAAMRLSSKSHWDVPVTLPGGKTVHLLCSHPTPPAFDGPEGRNQRRNHDEIRFWSDYLRDAAWIRDDRGVTGGLDDGTPFVILGDLNLDPERPSGYGNAMRDLLAHPRMAPDPRPISANERGDLPPEVTAGWGRRVDYALPSVGLTVLDSGILDPDKPVPSDHFPVWLDVLGAPQ
ncbi:MAG: endonuclease/exonuclease/phosphatase family protein [Planctomycetota bacterium]